MEKLEKQMEEKAAEAKMERDQIKRENINKKKQVETDEQKKKLMLETVSHIYGNLDWSTKFNVNNM